MLSIGKFNLIIDKNPIQEVNCAEKIDANKQKKHETVRKDLPTYSADDVSKHSGDDS